MKRWSAILPWILLALAAADLVALKTGTLVHRQELLAALFFLAALAFLVRLGLLLVRVCRSRNGQFRSMAEAILLLGVLLILGGGSANWLLGLQGYVILHEGEQAHLYDGSGFEQFAGGPLADLEEMALSVGLTEVELVPGRNGMFSPKSRVFVHRHALGAHDLAISTVEPGASGPLRFRQGAFGFSPRIVVLHRDGSGEPLYDEVVPFVTSRQGPAGLTFSGSVELEDGLAVSGAVDLDSLDEGMRGHATLRLVVDKDGRRLGEGALLPGKFAEVAEGYRVGFAGLEKWSEIVVSRRNYTGVMQAGAVLTLIGALAWPVCRWRGW